VRGAYHFGRPDLGNPEGEATAFLDAINRAGGLKVGDLLALDVEEDPLNRGNLDRTPDLPGWCLAFVRHVESKVGFKPLIYSNPSILTRYDFASYPTLGGYGLWLAAYRDTMPDPPAPWSVVAFWQCSSEGNLPGVDGSVDVDVFNGRADRITLYGKRA
jgi:GH25 family lysozyme M1 (1,4-beta-N-acetylmuramidase)